jgi:hypothetical protein
MSVPIKIVVRCGADMADLSHDEQRVVVGGIHHGIRQAVVLDGIEVDELHLERILARFNEVLACGRPSRTRCQEKRELAASWRE